MRWKTSLKYFASSICISVGFVTTGSEEQTFGQCKRQLILALGILGHLIAVAEDIRMKLLELNRVWTNAFHPVPPSNVLRDKSGPDGDRLHWPATGCSLEAYASRIWVVVDAESMFIFVVNCLAASC